MFEEGFSNPRHACTNGGGRGRAALVSFSNQNVQNINIISTVNNVQALPERMEAWIKSENNEVKECLIGLFTSEFRIVFNI